MFVLCFLDFCAETSIGVSTETSERVSQTDTSGVTGSSQPVTSDTGTSSDTRTITISSTSTSTDMESDTTRTTTMPPVMTMTTSDALGTIQMTSPSSSTAATTFGRLI